MRDLLKSQNGEPAPEVQAAAEKFCTSCGAKVPEGNQFCQNCGQKI
ncbi:MAG: zinc-ribbon domain-containing protein [Ruminococcus sp.]|nr:zinc-ribbon domain-containing protein [Ruminococcus sp.]